MKSFEKKKKKEILSRITVTEAQSSRLSIHCYFGNDKNNSSTEQLP